MLSILITAGLVFAGSPITAPPRDTAAEPAAVSSRPAAQADELRVMSFNIRYGTAGDGENRWERRREILFDVIRKHSPDVLGLQEALRFQLDEIRKAVPGYAEIGKGRDDGKEKGEYSAILYRTARLQPVESGTFWLSDTPEVPGSKTWGNRLPRICTWARFEDRVTGGTFFAYNTHLDHQSQPSRERSTEMLAKRIAQRRPADAPVVVTGDFNADERNPAILHLLGPAGKAGSTGGATADAPIRLVDTFRVLHPDAKEFGTFNGFEGRADGAKIDYILVLPGTKVLKAEILRDNRDGRYPSDHFPLLTVVRLKVR